MEYLDTGLLQSGHGRVIGEMVDDFVTLGENRSYVRQIAVHRLAHAWNGLRQGEHLNRTKQCFRRITCPVVAFAADEAILDQSDLESFGSEVARGVRTTRAASDDGNVEFCCLSHGYVPSSKRRPALRNAASQWPSVLNRSIERSTSASASARPTQSAAFTYLPGSSAL